VKFETLDSQAPILDSILNERSGTGSVLVCGAIAALPVTVLVAIMAGILVFSRIRFVLLQGWLPSLLFLLMLGAIVGALSALLVRWGSKSRRWGDLAGGLLFWPTSFVLSYCLVLLAHVAISRPNTVFNVYAQARPWIVEAIPLSGLLAVGWFASWRAAYRQLLRRLSDLDQQDIMAGVLRRHYHEHLSTKKGPVASSAGPNTKTTPRQ
jgi:hypothetical protein